MIVVGLYQGLFDISLLESQNARSAKSLQSYLTLVSPWNVACQASLSLGFSKQEHWSGLPVPPPRDLPDPGMEPMSVMSPALVGRLSPFKTRQMVTLRHLELILNAEV